MTDSSLHPLLERDCHRLGRLPVCHVLLHRNAAVPWWILVPEVAERELFRIERPTRSLIERETDAMAEFVLANFAVEKLNIAAIGNVVPQLHIHVIGRHPGDPCWPLPVWGHLEAEREYTTGDLTRLSSALESSLGSTAGFTPS